MSALCAIPKEILDVLRMEIILREVVGAFHIIENGDSQMIADDSGRHRR